LGRNHVTVYSKAKKCSLLCLPTNAVSEFLSSQEWQVPSLVKPSQKW
jgi:hypothetical protein